MIIAVFRAAAWLIAWLIAACLIVGVLVAVPCLLYALWCRVRPWFRKSLAWVRYRTALLLGRPVPEDGAPLDADEARVFIGAVRAWDLPACEPAREQGRRT